MNFSQMKLSTKLSAAFFVLIVLTMVVGTISVFKMAQIDRAVNEIPDGHPNSPAYGHLKLPHLN